MKRVIVISTSLHILFSEIYFLIALRMAKATELLKMTSLSIAEVGAEVGYPDQLHFSRAFKNVYGVSPRAWRKQNSKLV